MVVCVEEGNRDLTAIGLKLTKEMCARQLEEMATWLLSMNPEARR